MPGKLIITRGLPASGKTSWAKDYCAGDPGGRVRVNRDDLRLALNAATHGFSSQTEGAVTIAQEAAVRALLRAGRTVVVDDQNLMLRYAKNWSKIAFQEESEFVVIDDFLRVDYQTCIARDLLRDSLTRVGEDYIRKQYFRYVRQGLPVVPDYEPPAATNGEWVYPDHSLPKAILVDLDGTMALMHGRGPHDLDRVLTDLPNRPVVDLVSLIEDVTDLQGDDSSWAIIFMSGRDEICREDSLAWLNREGFGGRQLFMRPSLPDGVPQPKDSIVKLALFNEHIRGKYDVQFVLDDRDQVVAMWRQLGLTCLQVADGDF